MAITVSEDVKKHIMSMKHDFRICTACRGPALVSTDVKPAKESDIKIPVGDYMLYVSSVQAPYITEITMDMIYDEDEIDSCPAFYGYHRRRYEEQHKTDE